MSLILVRRRGKRGLLDTSWNKTMYSNNFDVLRDAKGISPYYLPTNYAVGSGVEWDGVGYPYRFHPGDSRGFKGDSTQITRGYSIEFVTSKVITEPYFMVNCSQDGNSSWSLAIDPGYVYLSNRINASTTWAKFGDPYVAACMSDGKQHIWELRRKADYSYTLEIDGIPTPKTEGGGTTMLSQDDADRWVGIGANPSYSYPPGNPSSRGGSNNKVVDAIRINKYDRDDYFLKSPLDSSPVTDKRFNQLVCGFRLTRKYERNKSRVFDPISKTFWHRATLIGEGREEEGEIYVGNSIRGSAWTDSQVYYYKILQTAVDSNTRMRTELVFTYEEHLGGMLGVMPIWDNGFFVLGRGNSNIYIYTNSQGIIWSASATQGAEYHFVFEKIAGNYGFFLNGVELSLSPKPPFSPGQSTWTNTLMGGGSKTRISGFRHYMLDNSPCLLDGESYVKPRFRFPFNIKADDAYSTTRVLSFFDNTRNEVTNAEQTFVGGLVPSRGNYNAYATAGYCSLSGDISFGTAARTYEMLYTIGNTVDGGSSFNGYLLGNSFFTLMLTAFETILRDSSNNVILNDNYGISNPAYEDGKHHIVVQMSADSAVSLIVDGILVQKKSAAEVGDPSKWNATNNYLGVLCKVDSAGLFDGGPINRAYANCVRVSAGKRYDDSAAVGTQLFVKPTYLPWIPVE